MSSRNTPAALAIVCLLAYPAAADAQYPSNTGYPTQSAYPQAAEPAVQTDVDREMPEHDRFRFDLAARVTSRTLDLQGPSEVLFDAPYYLGMTVDLSLFPIAFFKADSPAAGLGLGISTSKHVLNTVAAYEIGGETVDFDVPTRHDVTRLSLLYEWAVTERVLLIPELALHTVEVGLGYNELYRNSFYRGVDITLGVEGGVGPEGLAVLAQLGIRPAVDLGSTVEPFGSTASSFGIAAEGGLQYRSPIGLFGQGLITYERYATTYRPDRNEDRDDSTATDQFQSFVFSVGYAY